MIREILPNIFQTKVPLPRSPLGHLNSYLVKSEGKNLLIDTGLNFPEAFQLLRSELAESDVMCEDIDEILLTHFHADHVGLIERFKQISEKTKLLIHQVEADLSKIIAVSYQKYRERVETFLEAHGAPSAIATNLKRFHPAFFTPEVYERLAMESIPLSDGQVISIGNYNFQVLWTPGHSPGHVCLYEPSLKILFSGDHILPTITPHIAQFLEDMSPLADYLRSLEKTERLDVEFVLPAHEEIFKNHIERIEQLKAHHKERLTQLIDELKRGDSTACRLASVVHWNVDYKSWEEFPRFQKYLALGETVAHLNLLEQENLVEKTRVGKVYHYHAKKSYLV